MKPEDFPVRALQKGWADILKKARAHEPDWAPLEKVLPLKWCGGFMFMGYSGEIRLYKHGFTRNYLNLDPEGKPFRYTSRGYVPTSFEAAIEHVFEGLEELGETRSSVYDDAAVGRKHEAMKEAGWSVLSLSPDES